jgi:hypothetical protein
VYLRVVRVESPSPAGLGARARSAPAAAQYVTDAMASMGREDAKPAEVMETPTTSLISAQQRKHTHTCAHTHTHIYDIYGISTCYMSSCEVAELVCLWGWAEGEPPWNSKVASLCTVQAVCHTGPAAGRYGGWYYLPAVVS